MVVNSRRRDGLGECSNASGTSTPIQSQQQTENAEDGSNAQARAESTAPNTEPRTEEEPEEPDYPILRIYILSRVKVETFGMSKFGAAALRGKAIVLAQVAQLKLTPLQELTLDVVGLMESMLEICTTVTEAEDSITEPMDAREYRALSEHDRAVRKNVRWVRSVDTLEGTYEERKCNNDKNCRAHMDKVVTGEERWRTPGHVYAPDLDSRQWCRWVLGARPLHQHFATAWHRTAEEKAYDIEIFDGFLGDHLLYDSVLWTLSVLLVVLCWLCLPFLFITLPHSVYRFMRRARTVAHAREYYPQLAGVEERTYKDL